MQEAGWWMTRGLVLVAHRKGVDMWACLEFSLLADRIYSLFCWLPLIPLLIASAMDLRTWLCLHRYRPSPSALEQLLRMCSSVPIFEHRGHAGVSILPHMHR